MAYLDIENQLGVEGCRHGNSLCLFTAMNHCLETGGEHVDRAHFVADGGMRSNLADLVAFHAVGSQHHAHIVRNVPVFAECADDCQRMGHMQECGEGLSPTGRKLPRVGSLT